MALPCLEKKQNKEYLEKMFEPKIDKMIADFPASPEITSDLKSLCMKEIEISHTQAVARMFTGL